MSDEEEVVDPKVAIEAKCEVTAATTSSMDATSTPDDRQLGAHTRPSHPAHARAQATNECAGLMIQYERCQARIEAKVHPPLCPVVSCTVVRPLTHPVCLATGLWCVRRPA